MEVSGRPIARKTMFDAVEAFYRPTSIREAVRLLQDGNGGARFVAGGTDVIVQGDRSIRALVDVTRLGLNYVQRKGDTWAIGATATLAMLEDAAAVRALANGILAQAAAACGPVQIRNMATLGGKLAGGSPASEPATVLLALDAVAVLAGPKSRRKIPLAALNGSLLVEILIPVPPRGGRTGWSFHKLGRTESDVSLVNVAAGVQVDARGSVKWARIALGAVAPAPMRAVNAEKLLTGRKLDSGLIAEAGEEAAREVRPITDLRASAAYRREMSRVLTQRALRECAARAGCAL
jgi:CO/xanthine dehydrogenase FAD-binding subunit